MKILFLAVLVLVIVAALMAWVRLAPSDPQRWHGVLTDNSDKDRADGVVRVIPAQDAATLITALSDIIAATPRTRVLAGAPNSGSVTYITRSAFWGFPDFTTVTATSDRVIIFARLRFGQSDFGVNRRRVSGWISQLGVQAPS